MSELEELLRTEDEKRFYPELGTKIPTTDALVSEEDAAAPLWNDNEIAHAHKPQREREWHRLAVYLAANGLNYHQIAEKIGKSYAWVSVVLHTPYARKLLVEEIRQSGKKEIEALMKLAETECFQNVLEIARDKKAPMGVQLAANNSILDRVLGKPTQKVEATNVNVTVAADNIPELDKQLRELEIQEARLMGHNVTSKN